MLTKAIKAAGSEVTLFTSSEYEDVDEFQAAVNSWLSSQPDTVMIEDIVYQHGGTNSKGKASFSLLMITRQS